jgi:hypothetical protein
VRVYCGVRTGCLNNIQVSLSFTSYVPHTVVLCHLVFMCHIHLLCATYSCYVPHSVVISHIQLFCATYSCYVPHTVVMCHIVLFGATYSCFVPYTESSIRNATSFERLLLYHKSKCLFLTRFIKTSVPVPTRDDKCTVNFT